MGSSYHLQAIALPAWDMLAEATRPTDNARTVKAKLVLRLAIALVMTSACTVGWLRFATDTLVAGVTAILVGTCAGLVMVHFFLATEFKSLDEARKAEQTALRQGQHLLHTIIEAAPMAIVLLEETGAIVLSNECARDLFFEGKSMEGSNFLGMLHNAPAAFREAALGQSDMLFSIDNGKESETYHLSRRRLELENKTHLLIMVKHLTRELHRREVDIWKNLIRIISHELNNSLAPISSLTHSARLLAPSPEHAGRLAKIFDTIEDRTKHLAEFIRCYADFARLPKPRKEQVKLDDFIAHVQTLAPMTRIDTTPGLEGYFDRAQFEQVIINLLKNAQESGTANDTIELTVTSRDGGLQMALSDRGSGMSDEVLKNSILPFYSTKDRGSGLGLALCREIVEAHGGRIHIENRQGGGLTVTCWIPGAQTSQASPKSKITLSRI